MAKYPKIARWLFFLTYWTIHIMCESLEFFEPIFFIVKNLSFPIVFGPSCSCRHLFGPKFSEKTKRVPPPLHEKKLKHHSLFSENNFPKSWPEVLLCDLIWGCLGVGRCRTTGSYYLCFVCHVCVFCVRVLMLVASHNVSYTMAPAIGHARCHISCAMPYVLLLKWGMYLMLPPPTGTPTSTRRLRPSTSMAPVRRRRSGRWSTCCCAASCRTTCACQWPRPDFDNCPLLMSLVFHCASLFNRFDIIFCGICLFFEHSSDLCLLFPFFCAPYRILGKLQHRIFWNSKNCPFIFS